MIYDEEKRFRKQIWVIILGIIVVIVIVFVVFGFIVFKLRDFKVYINIIDFEIFSIGQIFFNMLLLFDIIVFNFNRVSFIYLNGFMRLFYYGDLVGQVFIFVGKIKFKVDEYLFVLLFVEVFCVIMNVNFLGNIVSGRFFVVVIMMLIGILKVLGVFKYYVLFIFDCDIFIFVVNVIVQSFYCRYVVRF